MANPEPAESFGSGTNKLTNCGYELEFVRGAQDVSGGDSARDPYPER